MGVIVALTLSVAGAARAEGPRLFEFRYDAEVTGVPDDQAVDVYVPVPAETPYQHVLSQSLDATVPATLEHESVFGNTFYHFHRAPGDVPIRVSLTWQVRRSVEGSGGAKRLSDAERRQFLAPDALVPVGHPILDPILKEIRAQRTDDSKAATARAIYDWVASNVEYKKVGTGWGNGDTFWACNERYGNCTDFHSLFISLARTEGIPAKFQIGFPVPDDRPEGTIAGYHCWVLFHLDGRGWVPIDASEASKFPARRELYFGGYPADRIHFTTGRDLVISPGTRKKPLNYFIYPHVEVNGQTYQAKVTRTFRYRDLDKAPVTAARAAPSLRETPD